MFDFLSHDFMRNAMILGLILGASAALLSSFLVLSKQSMIADGLSHVAFTGIIFGLLFSSQPIYFAVPFAIVASLIITYLGQVKMIEHDAAIGVVSTFTLAIGLITISLSDGFNRDIESLLTGTILSVIPADIYIGMGLLMITFGFITIFYRPLVSTTYDPIYAKFSKVKSQLLKYLLAALTATFIVIGVRTVGMLLISTFIIFPSLIASQISKSFKQNIIFSVVIALLSVFISVTISYHLDTPTGSTIVVFYTCILVLSIIYRKFIKK